MGMLLSMKAQADAQGKAHYQTPADLGGTRNSPHAWGLHLLEKKGLVDKKNIAEEGRRPRYAYRITPQGCAVVGSTES
jgi:hypothetical protein